MIVDDEPYNIEGVRMMLQLLTQQYLPAFDLANIDTAGNGLKAVDRVKSVYAQGQCFKLILMGCNMATKQLSRFASTSPTRVKFNQQSLHLQVIRRRNTFNALCSQA